MAEFSSELRLTAHQRPNVTNDHLQIWKERLRREKRHERPEATQQSRETLATTRYVDETSASHLAHSSLLPWITQPSPASQSIFPERPDSFEPFNVAPQRRSVRTMGFQTSPRSERQETFLDSRTYRRPRTAEAALSSTRVSPLISPSGSLALSQSTRQPFVTARSGRFSSTAPLYATEVLDIPEGKAEVRERRPRFDNDPLAQISLGVDPPVHSGNGTARIPTHFAGDFDATHRENFSRYAGGRNMSHVTRWKESLLLSKTNI